MIERRFGLAHLRGYGAVADRLTRLLFQTIDLGSELPNDVFDPQEIGLRRLQPQLGLMPAGMQAGNTGSFFQHAAALLRFGLDNLADPALMDERGRARAGRGVGKEDLHVARAHLAPVDAIVRTRIAFDPAGNFQRVLIVEGGRRRACRIVDGDRHLGIVSRGTAVGAGKDHVIHGRGAHGFVRGFAHHPAQRFDQIRFSAAVWTDHAGQARLDQEIGRFDERLEAEQAQSCELHTLRPHGSFLLAHDLCENRFPLFGIMRKAG